MKNVFLFLVLLTSLSARAGYTINGISYEFNTETKQASVGYQYERTFYNVVIPETVTYMGITFRVTSIGFSAFKGCKGLTSVTIPNSVETIGAEAFSGISLSTLIVGTGVLSFATSAFSIKPAKTIWLTNTPPENYTIAQGNVNYVSNNQYSGLSNVKEYKFLGSMFEVDGVRYVPVSPTERTCDVIDCAYDESLSEINIDPSVIYKGVSMKIQNVQPYTFYKNQNIQKLNYNIAGSIGKYICYGCTNMQTVAINQNVTSVEEYAFNGCTKLETVVLPDAVSKIGQYAFSGCTGLKSVVIGDGTKNIGYSAFSDCSKMESIDIGKGTETIDQYAFHNCSKLSCIKIPGATNSIYDYAFSGCKNLKNVIMEDRETDGVLSLGSNGSDPLFADCSLDSVYIGRNILYSKSSKYGYSPFYHNTTLRSIVITDKEEGISDNEFYCCTNLQNVQIGDGVTSIGKRAFSGCSSLKKFSFGTQVKTIGQEAFSDCTAITSIVSKVTTPPVCGNQALDDINKWDCSLNVPEGTLSAYQAADQWKEFFFTAEGGEEIIPDEQEPIYNKCATPTINVVDGELQFNCETEDVKFISRIIPPTAFSSEEEKLTLPTTYKITVYAVKEGYDNSDVVTKEIDLGGTSGIRGDVNNDGIVSMPDAMFIVNKILNGKFPDE